MHTIQKILLIIFGTILSHSVSGQRLGPDTLFGNQGMASFDFGENYEWGFGLAIQSDDKILLGGVAELNSYSVCGLIRTLNNGALDTSLDADGKAFYSFNYLDQIRDLAIQTDGKIVAAIQSDILNQASIGLTIARFNTDGSLDHTFALTGFRTETLNVAIQQVNQNYRVAIQSDGKIITATTNIHQVTNWDIQLFRYNSNGTPDLTFGGTGSVVVDFNNLYDILGDIVIQPNGKIILAGAKNMID